MNWIFRQCRVFFVAFSFCLFLNFTNSAAGSAHPMLISLPISVKASMPVAAPNFFNLDESAEEQRVDERFIFRGGNFQNDYNQEDNDSEGPQPGFLPWNPGTRFIMLQLNDVISARHPGEERDSEESERTESSRPRKQKRRQKDVPEVEDYRTILEPMRWPNASTKKVKESTVKNNERSAEEETVEPYGAQPVVQYLKESTNNGSAIYDNVYQDEKKDFNINQWWGDY